VAPQHTDHVPVAAVSRHGLTLSRAVNTTGTAVRARRPMTAGP